VEEGEEAADHAEATRLATGSAAIGGGASPRNGRLSSDATVLAAGFDEEHEVTKETLFVAHLEAEGPAEAEVVIQPT
jgi:hypothetical protein